MHKTLRLLKNNSIMKDYDSFPLKIKEYSGIVLS